MNICSFSNLLLKITFHTRKQNNGLLFHVVILKVQAFATMSHQWMHGFSTDSELCKQNHCETNSCNSTSFWHLWPPRCLIRGLKRLKSLGAKSGLYGGCLRHSHLNFCDKLSGYGGLGTKWLSSFWSSEEATWWSQMPNWRRNAWSCHMMVLFTKHRILCWRHALTHNTLWPSGWLCGKVGHCSVFLCGNLKINCCISIHLLCSYCSPS